MRKLLATLVLFVLLTMPACTESLRNSLGLGLGFPIFGSLNDVAGTTPGMASLIGSKNSVGANAFWDFSDWSFMAGVRLPLRESTPFSSSQTVTTNPTLFFLDGSSGLVWAEFGVSRNFPMYLNKIMTFVPSIGLDYQPKMTGSVPAVSSGADFSPLFAVLGASLRLWVKDSDFFLRPGVRWAIDLLSFTSNPVSWATVGQAQQVVFVVNIGYAYGN